MTTNMTPTQRSRGLLTQLCTLVGAAREAVATAHEVQESLDTENLAQHQALPAVLEGAHALAACAAGLAEAHEAMQRAMLAVPDVQVAQEVHARAVTAPPRTRVPDEFRLVIREPRAPEAP